MAWRTACRPPRRSCSATGICSGRSAASMALRCTVDVGADRALAARRAAVAARRDAGRRADAARRPATAGRSPRSPPRSSRPLCLTRTPRRGACHGRSRRVARRRRRRAVACPSPGARMTETSGARLGVPLTSMRPSVFSGERGRLGRGEREDLDALEARSRRRPAARRRPSRRPAPATPRRRPWAGARPAARQVQDPSPVWLVNSMSIRRDMRRTRYLASARGPDAAVRMGIP